MVKRVIGGMVVDAMMADSCNSEQWDRHLPPPCPIQLLLPVDVAPVNSAHIAVPSHCKRGMVQKQTK